MTLLRLHQYFLHHLYKHYATFIDSMCVRLPQLSSYPHRTLLICLHTDVLSVCTFPPCCLLHTLACHWLLSEKIQELILWLVLRCRNEGVSVSDIILEIEASLRVTSYSWPLQRWLPLEMKMAAFLLKQKTLVSLFDMSQHLKT